MLICPNCSAPLLRGERAFRCKNGHSFDIAASGYCNLLIGSKPGEFTGDSREMVAARRSFLDSGAYEPLRNAVCERTAELAPAECVSLLDAGCGEGYYTRAVAKALADTGRQVHAFGADISKSATEYAAKRDKLTQYITASAFRLPFVDGCADIITSLFAPAPAEEFSRVLKRDGTVLLVVPGREHLLELKRAVYDVSYENDEDKHALPGFSLTDRKKLTYTRRIESAEQIRALFSMTPYWRRTPKEGIERLMALKKIDLTLSFVLLTFQKA